MIAKTYFTAMGLRAHGRVGYQVDPPGRVAPKDTAYYKTTKID